MSDAVSELRRAVEGLRRELDQLRTIHRTRRLTPGWQAALTLLMTTTCAFAAARVVPATAAATKVSAPFGVVNDKGEVIFLVQQKTTGPSVEVLAGSKSIVQIGNGDGGNAGIRINTQTGARAAALAAIPGDSYGALQLYKTDFAEPMAWMYGSGPHGAVVAVSAAKGVAHASLGIGAHGGKLELADVKGMLTAEGGVLPSGSGVFRVRGKFFQFISGDGVRPPGF
jgi:hypothetical protein